MRREKKVDELHELALREREEKILSLFRDFPARRYTMRALLYAGGGEDAWGREDTKIVVDELLERGIIEAVGSGKYKFAEEREKPMEGVVDMLASGSAYIKVEGQEKDVYVSHRDTAHALHGDRVVVVVRKIAKNGTPEGEIVEVLERADKTFVGVWEQEEGRSYGFVRADSRKMPVDIFVHLDDDENYESGSKVSARVVEWPAGSKSPTGKIVSVFGMVGDNDAEMHAILAEYDLPYKFEQEVIDDAARISDKITAKDIAERKDMRGVTTLTIDPADAKDFDDALSVRKNGKGNFEIGIHIADVTHYVRPGSIVETEAENRATSVYLVDRTVPMLPERLSNDLCSLRPNEDKLAFSVIVEMSPDAQIVDQWIGKSIIRSVRRFTYDEAQKTIETGEGDYKEEILWMDNLAKILRRERFDNGAITFDRDEAKFVLDENGKPTGVFFKEQKESNHLIEEFMLLANKTVASFVGQKRGAGANAERTFVYRVHDEPDPEKLTTFRSFISRFGYDFKVQNARAVSKEMNRVMSEIKGKSEENMISTLAIRTMAKAYYTTENIGHYGLAFDFYSHFTSPIRRYPDMMVHRLLAHYLAGGKSENRDEIEALCEHSSDMEVRATEAERASIKYKMVEFMTDHVGEEFDGHISGVTEWGVYVELDDTHIEGMVSLRDLTDDYYMFNEDDYAIVGQNSGRSFTLGDGVRIRVLRADLARKQLDFGMTASYDFKTREATAVEDRILDAGRAREGGGRSKPREPKEKRNFDSASGKGGAPDRNKSRKTKKNESKKSGRKRR